MSPEDHFHSIAGQSKLTGDTRWRCALLPAVVLGTTFLAYVATLAAGFVADDGILIVTNDSIRSWRYLAGYFTVPLWSFRYGPGFGNAYRPMLPIWFRLNDGVFGLHAWGWHLSSLAAHLAVTYLVYRLGVRLICDTRIAAAGALVFGLHPIHVETIAEVSWADQPLSTLFVLATILSWLKSCEGARKAWWLAASMALCAAALLSKESSLMIPVLIGGYAWIYERRRREDSELGGTRARLRRALSASWPYAVVILPYLWLRFRALQGFAHTATPLPTSQVVFTLPSVLVFYLRLLACPYGLSCYYDTPYVSNPGWHDFLLPSLLIAAVIRAMVLWYRRTRQSDAELANALAFACLWMVLTLLPVLNFRLLPEGEIAHDRYLYLPSVGLALLVSIVLSQALRGGAKFIQPRWVLAGAVVVCGVMGVATARQCLFFSDDLVLSVRSHEIAPHNVTATTSLAAAVAARGMDGEAMALYQQALAAQPSFWVANRNLAYLYYRHGDYREVVHYLARSLATGPKEGDQFLILGLAFLRMGRLTEAEKAVQTALLLRPEGRQYHLVLGMVMREEGKLLEARREIQADLAADPQDAQGKALIEEVTRQMATPAENRTVEPPSRDPANIIK